jgi:hypothetical protein
MDFGGRKVAHKNKLIGTTMSSKEMTNLISRIQREEIKFEIVRIPAGYEHRPDLISNLFYETPNLYWLILLFNNIQDPLEGLNLNDIIKIPKLF